MTIDNFKKTFSQELIALYPIQEIQSFFFLLMERFTNMSRVDLALNPDKELSLEKEQLLNSALIKLKEEYPIQYIIGNTEFYGLPFMVNDNVLIPRPETEELVSWILQEVKSRKLKVKSEKLITNDKFRTPTTSNKQQTTNLNILDIGTGSGCIAISLAKNLPDAKVWALDVSENALQVARINAVENEVEINFIKTDILKRSDLKLKFDIIVSNPPYIREHEKKQMKNNVLKYEPEIALFVKDNNALLFYDRISDLACKNLKLEGKLYFEINQALGDEVRSLLTNTGFKDIKIKKDIYGVNRMVKANLI